MGKKKKKKKKATPRRPTDVNQLAHFLGEQSTKQAESNGTAPSKSEISRVMSAMGRRGGKIGGKKRAESLTPEKRQEIALKAARARWDKT